MINLSSIVSSSGKVVALILCGVSVAACAQSASAKDRQAALGSLAAGAEKLTLETASTPAYHLLAEFKTFDPQGQPAGVGTVDAYWDGKARWRRTISFKGATRTIINDGAEFGSKEPFAESAMERALMRSLFNPLPVSAALLSTQDIAVFHTHFGELEIDCLQVTPKPKDPKLPWTPPDPGSSRRYCLTGADLLRVTELPGGLSVVYNRIEPFGSKILPRSVGIGQGKVQRGVLEVKSMTPWQVDDAVFAHADLLATDHRVSAADVPPGELVQKQMLEYPYIARERHIMGAVYLGAVIQKDGSLSGLEVLTPSDASLAQAALEGVKNWRYRPFVVDGKPVEVETYIVATFRVGR